MNIIVTGAARGIGYALVRRLAKSGNHHIIAVSRNEARLNRLKDECFLLNPGAVVTPFPLDLSSEEAPSKLLSLVQDLDLKIDVLVNNAGLLVNKPFRDLTDKDFDDVFAVNVKAVFRVSQVLLDHFRKPAHIVNISSMGGVQGSAKFPGLSLYSASKGAVVILTETMAEELKDLGIKVNCLAFGAVQTDMLAEAFPGYKAPLQPEEMAGFVADFALNGHRFFNGKTLPVSVSTP